MSYRIENITLGYSDSKIVLSDFSLDIPSAQLVALVGRNGVGKSTLLRSLAGLVKCRRGDITIDGNSIFSMRSSELARNIAFVNTEVVRAPHLRVRDVVAMGRAPYTDWTGSLSDEDRQIVEQALSDVGVEHLSDRETDSLSDGERQRVMIARAIAQQTKIILLDEPSAFLDLPNRYQIVMLLHRIAREHNKLILFSSHDLHTAIKLCDSIWVMSTDGLQVGSPAELSSNGAFDVIFRNTPLKFNSSSGEVEICNNCQ